MKKMTMKENFAIMLWAMWSDCSKLKKYAKFRKALELASDELEKVKK